MLLPWYYIPQMALVKANLYFVKFQTNSSYGKKRELNLFMVYTTQISLFQVCLYDSINHTIILK